MGKVILDMSMSLDGYISAPNDDIAMLHDWMFKGTDPHGLERMKKNLASTRATVMGKRTFNLVGVAEGWSAPDGTNFELEVFVLTHEAQPTVTHGVTTFHFVTDGIESAVAQAKAAAGDKNVSIMGANTGQQCVKAGLLDEIALHLVPVMLGDGIRLFEDGGPKNLELESTEVTETPAVTHLGFRFANKEKNTTTTQNTSDIVRQYFSAWEKGERPALESLLADDFTFTSPNDDDHINKAQYFKKCWPGAANIKTFKILNLIEDGNDAFIRYECELKDGTKFRNSEYFRVEAGKIHEVDVYFGRNV